MNTIRSSKLAVFGLLLAAVVFGMVLASGLSLTPQSLGAPQGVARDARPQEVVSTSGAQVPDFADLAEAVLPAVVLVQATTIETTGSRAPTDPFEFFFRREQQPGASPEEFRSDGAGSGFVVSPDGWIVTNHHVVDGATSLTVTLNEHEYEAEVKGIDPATDLALLKIRAEGLRYLALGDSEKLRVGEWVMAVGNPLRLTSSVTVGVVSAKGRSIGITNDVSFENFIQTDAAINRGNSGGPIVNTRGEVVGISTAMNFGAENIGFAVPVDTLKQVLPQLREEGRVRRGYLGVSIENIDDEKKEAFGLATTNGALVLEVRSDTPAAKAGLQPGDAIVSVDGRDVVHTRDLIDYVSSRPPGSSVKVELVRDGKKLERKIELEDRPEMAELEEAAPEESEGETEWLGVQYQNLTEATRGMFGIPAGSAGVVVTEVAPSSPLYDEGVRPGNLIAEVNGEPVSDVATFDRLLGQVPAGSYARLYVHRFGPGGARQPFFAVVRVP